MNDTWNESRTNEKASTETSLASRKQPQCFQQRAEDLNHWIQWPLTNRTVDCRWTHPLPCPLVNISLSLQYPTMYTSCPSWCKLRVSSTVQMEFWQRLICYFDPTSSRWSPHHSLLWCDSIAWHWSHCLWEHVTNKTAHRKTMGKAFIPNEAKKDHDRDENWLFCYNEHWKLILLFVVVASFSALELKSMAMQSLQPLTRSVLTSTLSTITGKCGSIAPVYRNLLLE